MTDTGDETRAAPKLNVVSINELFGRFDGGGIVRVIVQEIGSNGIERPFDDVGAIIWHGAAPWIRRERKTLSHR